MSLSVCVSAIAPRITNSFRFVRWPVLPHAGPMRHGGFPRAWSKKVHYLQMFKNERIVLDNFALFIASIVAVARTILVMVHHMRKTNQADHELGVDYLDRLHADSPKTDAAQTTDAP